ncbi:MAG: hypothetical protein KKB90_08050 [Actinobacteria bacterium]|nr:hypothetical protein [Actinomycetota bacterium]MCG2817871.1 hypothetical protein [Actinomycetes bacterium]MBU4218897.1 hypothetical protein [Actinomycetota bacterium]MBU4359287.1 hypothetical protein [Actinomycetota bacterium]MBU4390940.1 hypothetical protein [Actinomycetota bacterium]
MKLSKKQSIIAVSVLFAVVAGILVTGFFFRPSWSSLEEAARARERAEDEYMEGFSKLPATEREATAACQENQRRILSVSISYYAGEGEYPPGGSINKDHPLVKKGYLQSVPTCPSTGKEYVLAARGKESPPTIRCPSNVPYHDSP